MKELVSREDGLVIVGDEAYTPEEWAYVQRRRANDRARYRNNPKRREQIKAAVRLIEAAKPHVIGHLHSLACTGPTIDTGCVCNKHGTRKIAVYDKPSGPVPIYLGAES